MHSEILFCWNSKVNVSKVFSNLFVEIVSLRLEMDPEVAAKVENYEKIINERLKTDLQEALNQRQILNEDMAEYMVVKETIEKIQLANKVQAEDANLATFDNGGRDILKTKVDLGCNFYANAVVEDTSRIFVAIGYGFFLEMRHDEALRFIDKKLKVLQASGEKLDEVASEINAKIRFLILGLKELQQLDYSTEPSKNSLFI